MRAVMLRRELRQLGRQWPTYWLRVATGLVGLLVMWGGFFLLSSAVGMFWGGGNDGTLLFVFLNGAMCLVLGCISPFLTADCVSQERRGGTLGLLFLTPLSPFDVAIGKCGAQLVRGLMLWCTTIPVMFIPIMLGGMTASGVLRALMLQFSLLLLGLGAGLLATRKAVQWAAAMGLAVGYAFLGLLIAWGMASGTACVAGYFWMPAKDMPDVLLFWPFIAAASSVASVAPSMLGTVGVPGYVVPMGIASLTTFAIVSVLWFLGCIAILTRTLRIEIRPDRDVTRVPVVQVRADDGKGDDATADDKAVPVRGKGEGKWKRRPRCVESNPMVWLHRHSHGGRIGQWGWIKGVTVCWLLSFVLSLYADALVPLGWGTVPLLLLGVAMMSAGSYRREIEEGTLELLLVTTLPPKQIVTGRAWALVRTFGPALALTWILGGWLTDQWGTLGNDEWEFWFAGVLLCGSSLAVFPFIGMRCAMRRVAPLVGWGIVGFWGVVAPMIASSAMTASIGMMLDMNADSTGWMWVLFMVMWQGIAGTWWGVLTWRELQSRNFMLKPFQKVP